jgi:hypothetical protein
VPSGRTLPPDIGAGNTQQSSRVLEPDTNAEPDTDAESEFEPDSEFEFDSEFELEAEIRAFIDALVSQLPEFVPIYRELVTGCDDDPGGTMILLELADFVAERLEAIEAQRPVIERALGLIEHLIECAGSVDEGEAADLVGMAFFDSFSPEDRQLLVPWLGPRSRVALEALDVAADE